MLIFGAARANAQITTVVAPPKRAATNQQEITRREQVAQDSIARTTLTGMTQWVDSAAAALALHPDTGAVPASPATVTVPARPDSARSAVSQPAPSAPAAQPPEFRDGARAPDTATAIPTVALIGGVMALVGLLIRRKPTALKVRVRR
jgi:hypothetical protein